MRLKEKAAIITGGGAGIGRELALGYAREGANVVVVDIDLESSKKVKSEIEKLGRKSLAISVDIKNRSEIDSMIAQTVKEFGKVDILVNSAAIYPATPFLDVTEQEMYDVINVDLMGTFRCCQAAAKEMVKQKSGKIINISSGQGILGITLMSHYTAAKGGIIALTRALASELSPLGINVNCISPGLTPTDHVKDELPEAYLEVMAQGMALRRLARPDEYVGTAILLASDEGSYITGETIAVDGGLTNVLAPPSATGFAE